MDDLSRQSVSPSYSPAGAGELIGPALVGVQGDLPLDEIFLALADDAGSPRLRRAAAGIAESLGRGDNLAAAFRSVEHHLPPYLRRALAASTDDSQVVAVLEGLVQHETSRQQLRRQMQSVLIYPIVVFTLLFAVMTGAALFVVPEFAKLFDDFDLTLPQSTQTMLIIARYVPYFVLVVAALPIAYQLAKLLPYGRRLVHWLRTGVPFLGRLWIWDGQHEFASVLGALTSRQVSLDEALRCTEASLRDQNLARATRIAADKCERGGSLSRSMAESLHFDPTLTALVGWGESHGDLPAALNEAAVVFEQAIDLQASFLRRVLPPVLFIVVVSTIFFFVCAVMIPLIDLINNLSG